MPCTAWPWSAAKRLPAAPARVHMPCGLRPEGQASQREKHQSVCSVLSLPAFVVLCEFLSALGPPLPVGLQVLGPRWDLQHQPQSPPPCGPSGKQAPLRGLGPGTCVTTWSSRGDASMVITFPSNLGPHRGICVSAPLGSSRDTAGAAVAGSGLAGAGGQGQRWRER